MSLEPSVRASSPVHKPRIRVFAADGRFVIRACPDQADKLLAAGLAEWRGRNLRLIGTPGRRGLDGLRVILHETPENARNCYSFATRTLPAGAES